jgi:tRNA threonylcarbamoyladenosine biosynthesis protein TsaB
MITLVVEASTYAGSVALLDGDRLVAERSVAMRGREREALMPAVAEVLSEAGRTPRDLGRVVCGAGPGAFTSLRIAGGIAKGIAMAAGIPLVPVSSLALLVASQSAPKPGRYLAALDAMREEHYVELFDLLADRSIQPVGGLALVPSSDVERLAAEQGATALGPDRGEPHGVAPHARGAALITNMIDAAGPADLASWEPSYGRLAEAQVKWEAAHGRSLEVR